MIAFTKYYKKYVLYHFKMSRLIFHFLLALPINSLTHDAKGTTSYYFICFILRLLIRLLIQGLFHQLSTYFSTFPLRYYSLSLNDSYLALEDGSPNSDRLSSILLSLFKQCFFGSIIICLSIVETMNKQIII